MTPQFRDTIIAVLVLYFLIAFVGNLAEAEERLEPAPSMITLEKSQYEFLITILCDKHARLVELTFEKEGKVPPTKTASFTKCVKWAVSEFKTTELFRS
jgi:hypothetical protein